MHNEDVSLFRNFFRNKWVRVFLIVDAIIILIVIGLAIRQSTKISTINFDVAPIDATISINGDANFANGQYSIAPGTYQIEISRDGLESKTISVTVESHNYVAVTIFLKGTDDNFDFYKQKNNYGSYQKLKTIASADKNITNDKDTSAQEFISDYERALSIFGKLPIKGYVYADPSVTSSTGGVAIQNGQSKKECEKTTCLLVRYYGMGYEDAAIKEIRAAGYDPEDYQIIYERYS